MEGVSRRTFLALAGAAPVVALVGTSPADAKPLISTDRTWRAHGPVMLIGDSLSGGYVGGLRQQLVARGVGPFRYDIQGSRSIARASTKYPSGIASVKSARAAGFDPPAYVVALGTNDMWFIGRKPSLAREMVDELLSTIGRSRVVYFLNLWQTKGGSFPILNQALNAATGRWPNLHIADWRSLAKAHPSWHGKDGTHYTTTGAKARNSFLVQTMINAADTAKRKAGPSRSRVYTYVM